MNTPILFLLGAVALSCLGGLVVWIASRPRPERFGSSIDTFTRDLSALAPPSSKSARRFRHPRKATPAPLARHKSTPQNTTPRPGPAPTPQVAKPVGRFGPVPQDASMGARPKPGPRPGPRS